MKKLIGLALVVSVVLSTLLMPAPASAEVKQEFVIDGNLDVWYLEETPLGDPNDGYFFSTGTDTLNCISRSDGVSAYPAYDAVTAAEYYTAYDDNYIYVFIRVWDDELIPYDPTGNPDHMGKDSSVADYLEIWLDPDPNSQTAGKLPSEIKDGWWQQTSDEDQADIQMRMNGCDLRIDDYHNKIKPGYNGVSFAQWISDPANVCCFHFDNDPCPPGEAELELDSGFGIEARFPRADDGSGHYRVNCSIGTSSEFDDARYTWCLGKAWWLDYAQAVNVFFNDGENPFFNQDISGKQTKYFDSVETNKPGKAVVASIDQLPDVDKYVEGTHKQTVLNTWNAFTALSEIQQGYVMTKNYSKLAALVQKADPSIDVPGGEEPGPQPTEVTYGDLNGDKRVDASDALVALKAAVKKVTLTADQTKAADVNGDKKVDASDALLMLKKAVGKITKFPVEEN